MSKNPRDSRDQILAVEQGAPARHVAQNQLLEALQGAQWVQKGRQAIRGPDRKGQAGEARERNQCHENPRCEGQMPRDVQLL